MQPEEKSFRTFIDDLNICDDEHYLASAEAGRLKQQGWRVYQLLNGFIRCLRERKTGAGLALHEPSPDYGLADDELDRLLNHLPIQRFNDSTVQRSNEQ